MPRSPVQIRLAAPEETCRLAERLGARLRPGDTLLLSGPIGAGKSHFARCLIQSLQDIPEDVPSPTFTIVQSYDVPAGEIWHADLYRLGDPQELTELGLDEAFETAICLVEWPERLGSAQPAGALRLDFAPGDDPDARRLTLVWDAPSWDTRLDGLTDD
jgi:tRNA threonylcarbamoyladenosine biosynthesis protein TsaE